MNGLKKITSRKLGNVNNTNKKLLKSGFWFTISNIIAFLTSFLQTFCLAKFLNNNQYGVYSLLLIIITMFDSFSEFGVKDALIRQKEIYKEKLYTAFWIEFTRNIICFILLILLSSKISQYYNAKNLAPLIIVLSFKFLFNGLKNINLFSLYRCFDTKKLVLIQQIPISITNTLVIFLAYYTKNLLYISFAMVLGDLLSCIASYMVNPILPKFVFKVKEFKELFIFCINIFLLTTLGYLLRQIDYLYIGKYSGVLILGLYTLAYKITNIVITNVVYVINNVSYPLYSQINREKIKKYFTLFNELSIYIFILFSFSTIFYMKELINFVYGNKWRDLYQVVCALLFFAFLRMISALQGSIYKSFNKPQIDNKLCITELIIIIVLIGPLFKLFGIYGVITSLSIAIFIRFIISTKYMKILMKFNYLIDIEYKNILVLILYSLITNLILKNIIQGNTVVYVILQLMVYFVGYISLLFIIYRKNINLLSKISKN